MHEDFCEIIIHSPKFGDISTFVDLEDVNLCKKYRWNVQKCYEQNFDTFYIGASDSGKMISMHRLLINAKKGKHVDHIDGDKLNNRKSNLRECSRADNMKNRKLNYNNKSGHKGVFWYYYNGVNKWKASITVDGKRIWLGSFERLEDAVRVRKEAEEKYHGEFNRDDKFLI